MPTNYLRSRNDASPVGSAAPKGRGQLRIIEITIGRARLRAQLFDTAGADRLWAALPLFSTAETWGNSIHFEVPVHSGRERNARLLGDVGLIYYQSHEERILIPFGQTPISRQGEIRLPAPCNVVARCMNDTTVLKYVTPGEKVSIKAASND